MRKYYRHQREGPIFDRPKTKGRTSTKPKAISSIELPQLYTRQLRHKIPEVCLSDHNEVRREICKQLTFKKEKVQCLLPDLYEHLPQEIKAISYSSAEYLEKLQIVNKIWKCCDLSIKERDVILARGNKSQSCYIFFTNFAYHPQSLCCDKPVFLKCIEKNGIESDQSIDFNRKWQLLCISCLRILLKISENAQKSEKPQQFHNHRRKLLDFALHIASGRYKKHLLQEDPTTLSFQHVKSRFTHIPSKKPMKSLQ